MTSQPPESGLEDCGDVGKAEKFAGPLVSDALVSEASPAAASASAPATGAGLANVSQAHARIAKSRLNRITSLSSGKLLIMDILGELQPLRYAPRAGSILAAGAIAIELTRSTTFCSESQRRNLVDPSQIVDAAAQHGPNAFDFSAVTAPSHDLIDLSAVVNHTFHLDLGFHIVARPSEPAAQTVGRSIQIVKRILQLIGAIFR